MSSIKQVEQSQDVFTYAKALQEYAASQHFDWPNIGQVLDKLQEEIIELRTAIASEQTPEINAELGDMLFCCVNIARHLHLEPKQALHETNLKFIQRFTHMEQHSAQPLSTLGLTELEQLWQQAKQS